MSQSLAQVWKHAQEQLQRLNEIVSFPDCCVKWIVAGSYRRLRPEVGDIDIVAIPGSAGGLFGDAENALWMSLDGALRRGEIHHPTRTCWGATNRRFIFEHHTYDIATCDETAWPVLVAVKTGPEKFTKGLVTRRCEGGMLPDDLTVGKDDRGRPWRVWRGRVVDDEDNVLEQGQQLAFDDERQFIEMCCGEWVKPEDRR